MTYLIFSASAEAACRETGHRCIIFSAGHHLTNARPLGRPRLVFRCRFDSDTARHEQNKRTMNKISAALITIGALSTLGVLVYGIETGTMHEHEHAFMFSIITFLLGICAHIAKELKRWD